MQLEWYNETCKLAFILAALCGLRAGEISGLRVCDVNLETNRLHIEHSFSEVDNLKDTKNHDIRDLPVRHSLAEKLIEQAKTNPYYSNTSYVFYAPYKPEAPFYPGYYADVFYKALEKIGISKDERKKRNIVFHSLRHFCATSVAFRTDMNTVMSIMGHKTKVMSEHYSNHESEEKLKSIRTIMNDVFEKYL